LRARAVDTEQGSSGLLDEFQAVCAVGERARSPLSGDEVRCDRATQTSAERHTRFLHTWRFWLSRLPKISYQEWI
jgi:hypothetical protein